MIRQEHKKTLNQSSARKKSPRHSVSVDSLGTNPAGAKARGLPKPLSKSPGLTNSKNKAHTPQKHTSSSSDSSDSSLYTSLEHNYGRPKIAIMGGGAGGLGAAIELANSHYHIDLYERAGELLLGTSNQTPGRAGLGFHYVHEKTAELYLKATIEVAKRYPDYLLGADDNSATAYLRHGLYCIMKQKEDLEEGNHAQASIYSKEKVLNTYNVIKESYRALVVEDPSNMLFGDPDDFYKILTPEEMKQYRDTINLDLVDIIVDTKEQLLNWPKLRQKLIAEVNSNPYITVHLNSVVDNPERKHDGIGFRFTVNGKHQEADICINATWEGIEALNKKLGLTVPEESRTNRLKIIVTMEPTLAHKEHPSVFCAMGPHTMVSNMGNGTIMCTYSPVTNVSLWSGSEIPTEIRRFLANNIKIQEEMIKAAEIRAGASRYLPFISDAVIVKTGYGIIKTRGKVDLFDPNSEVNKREEIGVEEQLIGWIDNACMKLLHLFMNGKDVVELVEKTTLAQRKIVSWAHKILQDIYATSSPRGALLVKVRVLAYLLSSALTLSYRSAVDFEPKKAFLTKRGLFATVQAKKNLMDAILRMVK